VCFVRTIADAPSTVTDSIDSLSGVGPHAAHDEWRYPRSDLPDYFGGINLGDNGRAARVSPYRMGSAAGELARKGLPVAHQVFEKVVAPLPVSPDNRWLTALRPRTPQEAGF
jgi:hypothetical protein